MDRKEIKPRDCFGCCGWIDQRVDREGSIERCKDHHEGEDDDQVIVVEIERLIQQKEIAEHKEEAEGCEVIKKADANQESNNHHRVQEKLHVCWIRRRMDPSETFVLKVKVGSVVKKRVHLVVSILCPHKGFIGHQKTPKNAKKDQRARVDGLKLIANKLVHLSHKRQFLGFFFFLDLIFLVWNLCGCCTSLSDVCHPFCFVVGKKLQSKKKKKSDQIKHPSIPS